MTRLLEHLSEQGDGPQGMPMRCLHGEGSHFQSSISGRQARACCEIVDLVRTRRSPAEQAAMRRAAALGVRAVDAMRDVTHGGNAEADLAAAPVALVANAGGALANIFVEASAPARSRLRRSLPAFDASTPLSAGDPVLVDVSGVLNGYFCEPSRSWVVDGEPSSEQRQLIELCKSVVSRGIEGLRAGATAGAAVRAGIYCWTPGCGSRRSTMAWRSTGARRRLTRASDPRCR